MIREFRRDDLVWLKPMAERHGAWEDIMGIANDPDGYGVVHALVIPPYTLGVIVHDAHGAMLEGMCDRFGIKQMIRLGDFMCQLADQAEIDLHNHDWENKRWVERLLTRWGFCESTPDIGYVRYVVKQAEQGVVNG